MKGNKLFAPILVTVLLCLWSLAQGVTILLVEQNAKMALSIADRAYVLETGDVVMEGEGQAMLKDDNVRKAYLGA